jgi:hypothetical protein
MEDKRGTKHSRSPSAEGSPSPDDAKTPPSASSGSPPPLGSPSELSSRRPCSSVFEQAGASRQIPVGHLSLSFDEENAIIDTSWDDEFARRLFGNVNRDVLEPPSDGKVIVLNDSNEEEEVHEETAIDADAAPSAPAEKSLTLAASTANADEDPEPRKMIVVMV